MKKMILFTIFIIGMLALTGCQKQPMVGNDKDEHGCIGSAGYSWCEVKQKCLRIWEENCTSEQNSGIANPASVFCEQQGGSVEIVTEEAGQRGICTLKDGTKCDEWQYFRGECPLNNFKNITCTAEAKICPDGVTAVGRTGPNCEFAKCPGEI